MALHPAIQALRDQRDAGELTPEEYEEKCRETTAAIRAETRPTIARPKAPTIAGFTLQGSATAIRAAKEAERPDMSRARMISGPEQVAREAAAKANRRKKGANGKGAPAKVAPVERIGPSVPDGPSTIRQPIQFAAALPLGMKPPANPRIWEAFPAFPVAAAVVPTFPYKVLVDGSVEQANEPFRPDRKGEQDGGNFRLWPETIPSKRKSAVGFTTIRRDGTSVDQSAETGTEAIRQCVNRMLNDASIQECILDRGVCLTLYGEVEKLRNKAGELTGVEVLHTERTTRKWYESADKAHDAALRHIAHEQVSEAIRDGFLSDDKIVHLQPPMVDDTIRRAEVVAALRAPARDRMVRPGSKMITTRPNYNRTQIWSKAQQTRVTFSGG